jgi:DNA-binding SARP family transcriptional activator/tetratricopeptide (TPR) repeat protein
MHCSAALPALAQKNIFLTIAGDGRSVEEYRFHPLFREFLLRRLRSEIGQAAVAAERNRIADHFLAAEQWELALPYLLDAKNFGRAAELIADRGGKWIEAGAFTSLGQFLERVPAEELEKFPRSLLFQAEIARLRGELEASSGILRRAAKFLSDENDSTGEAEALHSLASLARRRGRLTEAFGLLERAESLVPQDSETYLKCANTRGLCLIAQRRWTDAEQQFRFALDLAESQANERYIRLVTHNLALPPGYRGDFGEALRWLRRIFRDDRPDKQLPQEAIGHLNIARLHLYRGEFAETERHLERSLELCQLYNLKSLRAEVFEAYANFHRERGDLVHAAEFYERALKAYDEAEVDISNREFDEERAKFYILRGDLVRARTLLERLIAARGRAGNETGSYTARAVLARVSLIERKTDGLAAEAASILEYFQAQNLYYDEALTSLLLAEINFAAGAANDMIASLQRVLDLSARFDYDYWLRGEIRRIPAMFSHEDIVDRLPLDLREEISAPAAAPAPAAASAVASAPVTDLSICLLGPIEIHRDPEKPFAADAWTTRRARDIFCCIASSRHRRVQKDALIEMFWSDEDLDAIEKNFHPTISHIRKALNSRQTLKQNFLMFRDGAYQLNPELSYSIDTEAFELALAAAEKAKQEKDAPALRAALESAHSLYRGEFMPGVYEDWAEQRRTYYREQFARILAALAKQSFSEKRWSAALKFANQILADDPYREDMHRLVMKTFAAQSKPAAVRGQFETLTELLKKDLGITPAPETRRVFDDLTK